MENRASYSQVTVHPSGRRMAYLAMALIILLGACGSSSKVTPEQASPGGTFVDLATFATGAPAHIDPALATDSKTSQIAALTYEGLSTTLRNGEIRNALAQTAVPNADATVWIFTLRKDVKFSNGARVLPSDFKFAWQRALNPALTKTPDPNLQLIAGSAAVMSGKRSDLSGVVADDAAATLTVTLTRPVFDFLALVATPPFSPLPAALFADPVTIGLAPGSTNSVWETTAMIGNGPFKIANPWTPGQNVSVVRNDAYYGGTTGRQAYLDGVNFEVSTDYQAALNKFAKKNGGNLAQIVPGKFSDTGKYASVVIADPLLATEYWGFNLTDPVVGGDNNLLLRQAIAMAINNKDIDRQLYKGSREAANAWSPPVTPGYQLTSNSGDRNVPAANDALREWGKPPPTLQLSFPSGDATAKEATIIKDNLNEVGITATLNPVDPSVYASQVEEGKFQFFWGNYSARSMSYDAILAPPFLSSSPPSLNPTRFTNAEFDSDLYTARLTPGDEARSLAYHIAEGAMHDHQPVVPITWVATSLMGNKVVRDVHVDPMNIIHYSEVWLKK